MKKIIIAALLTLIISVSAAARDEISASGMGPIKIGMKFKDVPRTVSGLYSQVVEFEDEGGMDLMSGNTLVMSVYGDNTVESISLSTSGTGMSTAEGVEIGMPAQKFFALPGWTEIVSENAMGQYYTKDGVTAIISFDLTPAGLSNYENGGAIRKQDFSPDAIVESIMVGNFDLED